VLGLNARLPWTRGGSKRYKIQEIFVGQTARVTDDPRVVLPEASFPFNMM
jgi:hypothetical protein